MTNRVVNPMLGSLSHPMTREPDPHAIIDVNCSYENHQSPVVNYSWFSSNWSQLQLQKLMLSWDLNWSFQILIITLQKTKYYSIIFAFCFSLICLIFFYNFSVLNLVADWWLLMTVVDLDVYIFVIMLPILATILKSCGPTLH